MKFKSLFLGMLGAALFVGCNNDTQVNPGPDGPNSGVTGESTTATFELRFSSPGTYAPHSTEAESTPISDAALFLYKKDGTPEAMIYATNTDYLAADANGVSEKVTVKCKSGEKLVYLAVNLGNQALITHSYSGTNAVDPWLGQDWTGAGIQFVTLNAPVWSNGTTGIAINTPNTVAPSAIADPLLKALANAGNPATGDVKGSNTPQYLMTNWGDATYQEMGEGSDANYNSTVLFTLQPSVSALDSRQGIPSTTSNPTNSLKINVQRSLAKVSVVIDAKALAPNKAGGSSNSGIFTPDTKWALGNINMSEYPFQIFDPVSHAVMGTLYNESATIGSAPAVWATKLDNQRWIPTGKTYYADNLTVSEVRTRINSGYIDNQAFSSAAANRVLATENNSEQTYNHYSTFVVFAGKYTPDQYVASVNNVGAITYGSGDPSYSTTPTTDMDTLYYVQSYGDSGMFFWGKLALQQYVCYNVLGLGAAGSPSDPLVIAEINRLSSDGHDDVQNTLQAYFNGYCFYRVWIKDLDVTSPVANKVLVRRNHIYAVNITRFKGPGIGDPNDIIDPDPDTIEPIEEADTYVTATIEIMSWHVVDQSQEVGM